MVLIKKENFAVTNTYLFWYSLQICGQIGSPHTYMIKPGDWSIMTIKDKKLYLKNSLIIQ